MPPSGVSPVDEAPMFTSTTPAKPAAQPSSLRDVRRSERKTSAATNTVMKTLDASMMDAVMPEERDTPG